MARSLLLIVLGFLDRLHVRLHELMDRRNLEHWTATEPTTFDVVGSADTTVTYYDDRAT
jgi:hypothetical protein